MANTPTLNPFDTISDKSLRAAVERLPKKTRDDLLSHALGIGLGAGEFTIPDSDDLPPKLRAANRARIENLPPDIRAEMLGQS